MSRRAREQGRETSAEEIFSPEDSTDLSEVEEAFAVREALAGLSDNCQDILDRFFARDQSYKTIADELEIPSGTIASRIARLPRKVAIAARGKKWSGRRV
jgi:DNA-directed RNA polymerase specialized sigma24 family protein